MKLKDIQILVVTCHDPGTEESLASLYAEVDPICVKLVENVSPVSEAFNEAIRQTDAKWMFQVDSDQVLYSGFADKIQEAVNTCNDSKIFKIRWSSWDTFEEKNLYASCKLFNMEIVKKENIWFPNQRGCDREFMYAFQRRGFKVITHPLDQPIANHCVTEMGPGYAFSRFSDRISKDGLNYIKPYHDQWKKKISEGSVVHAGALIGAHNPRKTNGEKGREQEKQDPIRIWIDQATDKEILEKARSYIK